MSKNNNHHGKPRHIPKPVASPSHPNSQQRDNHGWTEMDKRRIQLDALRDSARRR
jgi:hypothetical protein